MPATRDKRKLFILPLVILSIALYCWGANLQLTLVNTNMEFTDQSAYMEFARTMRETQYSYLGDRNRMPVYPFIQSLFYEPGMSDESFFVQGKYVNLGLSLVLLAGIGTIFFYSFQWLQAAVLLLITAFTVFMFKAPFFQTELLFYFLAFCLFLLYWRMLTRPSWMLAIGTGIVAGVAHLTKASVLPGLVVYLAMASLAWLRPWQSLWRPNSRAERSANMTRFLAIVLPLLFFILTIFPYIRTSKQMFGHYFYNVNSTFYIWYDSWEQATEGTKAHGDRVGWPDMPAQEIPSAAKYMREHTWQQIVRRFTDNAVILVTERMMGSFGYFKYLLFYTLALVAAAFVNWSWLRKLISPNAILLLFLVCYFVAYYLLNAWYAPIVSSGAQRLILAQFLPYLYTISIGLKVALQDSRVKFGSHSVNTLAMINGTVLVVLIANIGIILDNQIGVVYGGY